MLGRGVFTDCCQLLWSNYWMSAVRWWLAWESCYLPTLCVCTRQPLCGSWFWWCSAVAAKATSSRAFCNNTTSLLVDWKQWQWHRLPAVNVPWSIHAWTQHDLSAFISYLRFTVYLYMSLFLFLWIHCRCRARLRLTACEGAYFREKRHNSRKYAHPSLWRATEVHSPRAYFREIMVLIK